MFDALEFMEAVQDLADSLDEKFETRGGFLHRWDLRAGEWTLCFYAGEGQPPRCRIVFDAYSMELTELYVDEEMADWEVMEWGDLYQRVLETLPPGPVRDHCLQEWKARKVSPPKGEEVEA